MVILRFDPRISPAIHRRPIRGPLRDVPLAFCDATSVAFTDFVPSDLVYRDRAGETYPRQIQPGAPLVLCA
jgi:hypothetical protein